jgi:hypothetical protein
LSVGPPSRSFAAASVQTTSLVNPASLLRTPLLRLLGVHETLSLHRQFATRQLSLWIPCLLVHFLAVSQLHRFRLLLSSLSLLQYLTWCRCMPPRAISYCSSSLNVQRAFQPRRVSRQRDSALSLFNGSSAVASAVADRCSVARRFSLRFSSYFMQPRRVAQHSGSSLTGAQFNQHSGACRDQFRAFPKPSRPSSPCSIETTHYEHAPGGSGNPPPAQPDDPRNMCSGGKKISNATNARDSARVTNNLIAQYLPPPGTFWD